MMITQRERMKTAGIYSILCQPTNKRYIGQSTDINSRISDHKRRLNSLTHENNYLQKAWNKYGEDKFLFEIIEVCKKDFSILNKQEIFWINAYETHNRNKGFNISSGGGNGYSLAYMTDKERKNVYKKIGKTRASKYSGVNHPNYGKPMSEEQKKKISEFFLSDKNPNRGVKRPIHSIKMTGENNPRAREVICITTNETFSCAKYAGNKYNTTNSNILKCCRGIQGHAGKKEDGTILKWVYGGSR